ncbi:RagB/SusD family nutrient uptake outer membrane protein [Segatella baroniae]|uniref:RagB/SusD family nutrient uptake outer membrane protein n=1 Tax=Segatella baroniae TaxID=305719 RepID=UPI00040826E8|nr:RagB/SusD family nutrient uptake outer membrane protein [Segatella baroniae]
MKRFYIFFMVAALGLSSCNDWLDVDSKTSIPMDKQFRTEEGFKDALTGVYLKLGTTTLYAGDLTYAYLDELAGLYSSYPGHNEAQLYDQSFVFDYNNRFMQKKDAICSEMYNVIANVNNLLAYLDKKRDVLQTERYYEIMKGEALGMRAFLHFDLLRLFGPVYKDNPTAPAIPYRVTYDRDATPVLPANQVVEAVLKDLNEAEQLLGKNDPLDFFTNQYDTEYDQKNKFLVSREFRMNLYAVKAMLARVYCYKGDAESRAKAVQYARDVIAANKVFTLYNAQTAANYNSVRYGEQVFGIYVDELSTLLDGNYMNMENTNEQYHFATSEANFNYFYEAEAAGNTDWRKNPEMFEVSGNGGSAYAFCRKYNQKPLRNTSDYSGEKAVPLIRLPEMYYIVAECESNQARSLEALNAVRFARGISYSDEIKAAGYDQPDATSTESPAQTKRVNELMKEYRKEYFGEGQLFYFLKAHAFTTYRGCGVKEMTAKQYQIPLPDAESIFGNNTK